MFDFHHGIIGMIWVTFLFVIELTVAFICVVSNLLPLYAVLGLSGLIVAWYHNKTLL